METNGQRRRTKMPRVRNKRLLALQECQRLMETLECWERKWVLRCMILDSSGSLSELATDKLDLKAPQ